MNDYNSGALPDPCLRLDYGFGDDWKSVELGDGTGYVRLADYEKVVGENDRLQELAKDMRRLLLATGNDDLVLSIEVNGVVKEVIDAEELAKAMRELGVDDG